MLTSAVSFGKRSDGLAYRHRIAYSDICNLCFSVGHNFIRLENRPARFDIRKIAAYILKLCQRRQFIGQCGDSEIKVVYPRNRNSVSDLIHCFHNEFPPRCVCNCVSRKSISCVYNLKVSALCLPFVCIRLKSCQCDVAVNRTVHVAGVYYDNIV